MTDDTYKDGGPAYPQPQVSDGMGGIEYTEVEGMSLRDWFAGQVLIGIYAADPGGKHQSDLAQQAYSQADWMLKAREES